MKKTILLIISFTLAIILIMPKAHAYTLSNTNYTYYNQTTKSVGQADTFDISSNMIEFMYYDLGSNIIQQNVPIRVVFSNIITTEELPKLDNETSGFNLSKIEINFYTSNHILIVQNISYFNSRVSLSYFETNFTHDTYNTLLDYITIKITNLAPYDEQIAFQNMNSVIIENGSSMIINQTVSTTQYNSGWNDAMNSKVTQIWLLWGNIFDTFMGVFNVFSVKLIGDITIGHLAMVPLVLGLIGFIYALGGKRGR